MTIGDGIAIAGVWVFVGILGISKSVTGIGLILGIICAAIVTASII